MRLRPPALTALLVATSSALAAPDAHADGPAYTLRADTDGPAVAVGAVFATSWLLRSEFAGPYCAPTCDRATLDALDRGVAGRYSPGWNRASDLSIAGLLVADVGVLVGVDGVGPAVNDAVVLAETLLWGNGLAAVANYAVRRPRPFAYGDAAPLAMRTDGNAAMSFFSGHTTAAFAASTWLFVTLHRLEPDSAVPWIALGVGALGSTFVGASRMLAGYHFPTDVLAGATVGVSLGFLVPALHGSKVAVAPMHDVTGRTSGVNVVTTF